MNGSFVRSPGVAERNVDDAVFLVGSDSESVFHLNPLTAAVWRLLAQPESIGEVINLLASAYPDIEIVQIEGDVLTLMKALERRGLVVKSD
jgi:hypothetical protein